MALRITRRRFLLGCGGLAATGAGLGAYTHWIEPFWLRIEHRTLPIAGLPEHWVGRRLVQISDLHAGQTDRAYLADALQQVNALKPDLLVITGDITDHPGTPPIDEAITLLSPLRADRAIVAILGNHDYGHRWRDVASGDELAAKMRGLGITVLRNEVTEIDGLHLGGTDDLWAQRDDPARVFAQLPKDGPVLMLAHNPDAVDAPEWQHFQGWTLSGHTHGGQCRAPLLGSPILPVQNRRYVAGEYDLVSGGRLYINVGLGYTKQLRFAVRPTITVFTLATV